MTRFGELPRVSLAHLPTPLWRHDALDAITGGRVWVKRDDQNGGAVAGNKVRKLEYLLADALSEGADCVLTCGGAQSNHARATTLCAAGFGLQTFLLLRSAAPDGEPDVGNLFLDRLAGASVRWVSPEQYAERDRRLADWAESLKHEGRKPYVIVEGGSNALGCMGYVRAMAELRDQLEVGPAPSHFDRIVVACGSGGTAAGVALGGAQYRVASDVLAVAVCDDRRYFEGRIQQLCREAGRVATDVAPPLPVRVDDAHVGPGYALSSSEQRDFIRHVARATGLVLDPVYSGKALHALSRMDLAGETLFVHTGGLPGLLAQCDAFLL